MNVQKKPVASPLTIFYSYAHEDEALRLRLEKHLSTMSQQGIIVEYHDRKILPGTDWKQALDQQLATASVILLLISPDFLASNYHWGVEMQRAMERHKEGSARVIPILLRPADYEGTPIADLQPLPHNAKPVTLWKNQDEAFLDIAQGIRAVLKDLGASPHFSIYSPSPPRVSRGPLLGKYDVHTARVNTVAWSPDGQFIASGGGDATVQIWNASTQHHILTYRAHASGFPPHFTNIVRWSPDGIRIASVGNSATVHVWNYANGQKIAAYDGHSHILPNIYQIAWSPDGQRIASMNIQSSVFDEALHIWNASNGRISLKVGFDSSPLQILSVAGSVTWSPDGTRIAGSWGQTVQICHSITGHRILTYSDHSNRISRVAWSPDGQFIASSEARRIQIWNPITCTTHLSYIAHTQNIRDIAWSPNGKYIASASEDKTVHVWDPTTGIQHMVYRGHIDCVTAIAWSPDSTRIASAGNDKTVHIWQVA